MDEMKGVVLEYIIDESIELTNDVEQKQKSLESKAEVSPE